MTTLPPAEFMRDKSREEIEAELVAMLRKQRAGTTEPERREPLSARIVDALLTVATPHPSVATTTSMWDALLGDSGGDGGGGDGGGGGD